ncbi:MAG: DUF2156 domain-containing protein, partial [Oligoflexia bacterium]|nr:DUF2156 domain-containing protein [Oligoflexia bacterium]
DNQLLLKLLDEWCIYKDCEESVELQSEKKALVRGLENWEEYELQGIIVEGESDVFAFSIYEKLNDNTILVHFEKAKPFIKGAFQLINQLTAQKVYLEGYKFINRECDHGLPGLRQAKQSYHPVYMEKCFTLEQLH